MATGIFLNGTLKHRIVSINLIENGWLRVIEVKHSVIRR
jgi:hypothetical protein